MASALPASRASLVSFSSRFSALSLRPGATLCHHTVRQSPQQPPSTFSTSASNSYPRKHRGNKRRGMSAIRGTGLGPWIKLSVKPADVEAPRKIEIQPEDSPDHGLWNFFNPQRTILSTPVEESRHGRAWTREELRFQSFQRLHSLWWSCLKEQNRIATENATRAELKAGHGEHEANDRMLIVRKTMKNIRWVLVERWYAWEDARKLAREDETIQIRDAGGLKGQLNREVVYESMEYDEAEADAWMDESTPYPEADRTRAG